MNLNRTSAGDHPNHISFTVDDYMQLLGCARPAIRKIKCGAIPGHLPPILLRLGLNP